MGAKIIDGKVIGEEIRRELAVELEELKGRGIIPGIATFLVGDDFGSKMYRASVEKLCGEMGLGYREETHPATLSQAEAIDILRSLDADPGVSGILPLRPFPGHVSDSAVINSIMPDKDIDCFHPSNMGRLVMGESTFAAATPSACIEIIERYLRSEGIDPKEGFAGMELCVAGRSNIVGKPVVFLALARNATPTIVHSFTSRSGNFEKHTAAADYLIVATGVPNMIGAKQVKEGAVVIDVGINRVMVCPSCGAQNRSKKEPCRVCGADLAEAAAKTVGDVNFDEVAEKAKAITPVPGGVGSVTNLMLVKNTLHAARMLAERKE